MRRMEAGVALDQHNVASHAIEGEAPATLVAGQREVVEAGAVSERNGLGHADI